MPDYRAHITYDRNFTPGIWARDVPEAYFGLGYVHGLHRPLQTLLLAAAGTGQLSASVWPAAELVRIDTLAHRLDLPNRAAAAHKLLAPKDASNLFAFVQGIAAGLTKGRPHGLLRALGVRLAAPSMTSVLSGLLLSSYVGLAESQDRMERAVVGCLQHGADAAFLGRLHAPHLVGWDLGLLRRLRDPLSPPYGSAVGACGGSNAWAVGGGRSASGYPLLCGDLHLPINQLPAILLPVRVRLPDGYWLGASIPGLPGLAVGRNATLAFSATFSCADNTDSVIDDLSAPRHPVRRRVILHRRRARAAVRLEFVDNDFGVFDDPAHRGPQLCTGWCSGQDLAEAMGAYMQLPQAASVAAARRILQAAHTLSLHYVLADKSGAIGQQQAGIVPRRTPGYSGLYPRPIPSHVQMQGAFYRGASMPQIQPTEEMVVSANEAGIAGDGAPLANLAQPSYRRGRIRQLLSRSRRHDVASMAAVQQDVLSPQALRLRPYFLALLPEGPVRRSLLAWDLAYDPDSFGAHAFSLCYTAALRALAPLLGGSFWRLLLDTTELAVWWCGALDDVLGSPATWQRGTATLPLLRAALEDVAGLPPEPWGRVQRVDAPHLLWGKAPGVSRASVPLVGSIATINQGNVIQTQNASVAIAPAFRMICDMGEDALYAALPGGIDERPLQASYAAWLGGYHAGRYMCLRPPERGEPQCMP